jgi:putative tricarboxylic transport membrane protein
MLGLLLSFVGYQTITGVHRFTFGTTFLYDGFEIIPLVLGLFGLSEMFDLARRGRTSIVQGELAARFSDVLQGAKDVWRHRWLWLRSTLLGYIIGIIPGIGAEVATWVCYGQAKQTSRHPERFGTGAVEGVIAPEAANNGKEAGSLLTTMAFGIPGSSMMAIFLAAFMIVGVTPGPAMLDQNLGLALTLLLGIALANVVGGIICLVGAPYLAKVASVNLDFVFTAVLITALAGVFAATLAPMSFAVVMGFGLLGLAMKEYGYSRPALILGFVLGALLESYSILSVKIYGPLFFFRPIPMGLFAITALVIALPYLRRLGKRPGRGAGKA